MPYAWRPAGVVATRVTSLARRWKKVCFRFQPMMPSEATMQRRRTSEPDRETRNPPTTVWPRLR